MEAGARERKQSEKISFWGVERESLKNSLAFIFDGKDLVAQLLEHHSRSLTRDGCAVTRA